MITQTIEELINNLNQREKEIIVKRHGLSGKKHTLASLGEKHNLTRERIRQIESRALEKIRKSNHPNISTINETIKEHLLKNEGLRREDFLSREISHLLNDQKASHFHIKFVLKIVNPPHFYHEDNEFFGFAYLDFQYFKKAVKFIERLEKIFERKKREILEKNIFDEIFPREIKRFNFSEIGGANALSISKKIAISPFGDIGLIYWPEINPTTIRDKAYLILKKSQKPLHFRDITNLINQFNLGKKKAYEQTVHNELIKDNRFVLVGRGIYALKENGFKEGTTKELIYQLLKKRGPLTTDQIIDSILKERILKENTIIINLQNKKYFKRLANGYWAAK